MKNFSYLAVIIIFVIGFFVRFYHLSDIPNGLQQDETSIGYNAYSILQTGKDERGVSLTLYFKAFGEYKLPGYIYASVLPIRIFGLNPFSVRFVSALAGALSVIVLFYLVREMAPKKKELAIVSALFLAITPWGIHFSRGAFEVSLALFFLILGSYFFLFSNKKKNLFVFLISLACMVLAMYTYNIARLFAPLLLGILLYFYHSQGILEKKRGRLELLLIAAVMLIAFIPLFLQGGASSTQGTIIFTSASTKATLLELRSFLLYLPDAFTKLFFNMFALTMWEYIKHVLSYLSVSFFFLNGSSHGNHGIGNVGQFFLFGLPFFLVGLVVVISQKLRWGLCMLAWIVALILVASLTREAPHATRSFFLLVPITLITAQGIVTSWEKVLRLQNRFLKYLLVGSAALLVTYNIVYYFTSYFIRFPVYYAKSWRSEDDSLTRFIADKQGSYDQILVDKSTGLYYPSLLFYLNFSPSDFHTTAVYAPDDTEGFSTLLSFDKYRFKEVDWEKDIQKSRTLFITTPQNPPINTKVIKVFHFPTRPVVAAVGQDIVLYPVEEEAYVVAETK